MNEIPYRHINIMVMPTDYCNMNCVYCFNARRTHQMYSPMSDETLEQIFRITIPFYEDVKFIWHGGEPLSMGLDFYKRAVELEKKYNINGALVRNSIQSNLTLLDDEFAAFLVENDFGIGGSFDGTQNDKTRHNTERILAGRETLLRNGGHCGFICVVQRHNVDRLIEDYRWFNERHINYSLNDYLSPERENDPLFVPEETYIEKMCGLFDHWMYDKSCEISLSTFEMLAEYLLLKEKYLCCYTSCLGKYAAVQSDGSIYNCNRTFAPEYCYGNVYDYSDIRQCFRSEGFERMLESSVRRRKQCMARCPIFDFCAGGCCSCAAVGGDVGRANEYVCRKLQGVYAHAEEALSALEGRTLSEKKDVLNPRLYAIFEKKSQADAKK